MQMNHAFSIQEKPTGFVMNLHLQYFYARSNLTQLFLSPRDLASGLDTILVTMRGFSWGFASHRLSLREWVDT